MKVFRMKAIIAGIVIFLLPLVISAQLFILQDPPSSKPKLTFKYFRPHFKEAEGSLTFLSGLYELHLSIPVNAKLNVVGSVPFMEYGWKSSYYDDEGESAFGDIFIGLQYLLKKTDRQATAVCFGVYVPTAPEEKEGPVILGLATNYYKLPQYFPNVLTIYGDISHHIFTANGLLLNVELGPYFMIPTKGGGDSELFIHYGLSGGYRVNPVDFNVEIAGVGILTEEADAFGDRFMNMLGFGVQWNRGWIRPGIFYQIYLKKSMSDSISGVIGIKLEIDLKK